MIPHLILEGIRDRCAPMKIGARCALGVATGKIGPKKIQTDPTQAHGY